MPALLAAGLTEQLRAPLLEEQRAREHLARGRARPIATPRRLVVTAESPPRQADREEPGLGPVAQGREGRRRELDRRAPTASRRRTASARTALEQAAKDPAAPEEHQPLFVKKAAGRDAVEVLPGRDRRALRALAFPKRMSWDAWLDDGKGAFPFGRPDPLDRRAARRPGRAVHDLTGCRPGPRAARSSSERRRHPRPPLPPARAKAGEPIAVALLRGPQGEAARPPSCSSIRRSARRGSASGLREGGPRTARRPRSARRMARPRRVSDGRAGSIPAEFQIAADARCSRPSSSITRSTSRSAARDACVALRRRDEHRRRRPRPRSCAGWSASSSRACATRRFFFAEDMKRPLEQPRRGPRGRHVPPGPRHLSREGRAHGPPRRRHGREMRLLTKPEHQAAREAARLAKADLTTLMVREFPELQGVMGGIYLRAAGTPWRERGGRPCAGTTTRSRSKRAARRRASSRRSDATRLRRRLARRQAGHAGRLLRPRPRADRQQRSLRPAARGPGRGPRAPRLLERRRAGAAAQPERLAAAAVAGYAGPPASAPPTTSSGDLEAFLLDRLRYVLWRGASRPTRSRRSSARASPTPSTTRARPRSSRGAAQGPLGGPRGLRAPGRRLQARQEHPRPRRPRPPWIRPLLFEHAPSASCTRRSGAGGPV